MNSNIIALMIKTSFQVKSYLNREYSSEGIKSLLGSYLIFNLTCQQTCSPIHPFPTQPYSQRKKHIQKEAEVKQKLKQNKQARNKEKKGTQKIKN